MKILVLSICFNLFVLGGALAEETDWRTKAVALARGEPKITEAVWSQDISFWVSVIDDGSSRNGYAEYLCFVLNEAGKPQSKDVIISVWDHVSMLKGKLMKLGSAIC